MIGLFRGRLPALMLFAAGMCTVTDARADIPFADQVIPGELRGIARTEDSAWPASYFEYLPSDFDIVDEDTTYPLLVTLGGVGTMDNISVCPDFAPTCTLDDCLAQGFDGLCRVLGRGPAIEIRQGVWDDVERPFIVVQPQNLAATGSAVSYDRDELDALVEFVIDNYPVDPRRLYLLGNSQGGRGVLQYLAVYNRRMAAASVGPGGLIAESEVGCLLEDTATWVFHGENDQDGTVGKGVFDPCWISRVVHRANEPEQYPADPSCVDRTTRPFPIGRLTMFRNTGHNAWTPAFENVSVGFARPAWNADEGMCGFETNWVQYDDAEFSDGVYTWLLQHDRPRIMAEAPERIAGDLEMFTLTSTVVDDDAWTVTWEQTSGPAVALSPHDDGSVDITEFEYDASYQFRVMVVDADGQWNDDTVDVSVAPEVVRVGTSSSSGGSGTGDAETGSGLSTGAFTSSTTDPGDASTTDATAEPSTSTGASSPSTASSSGVEDTDSDGESSTAGSASSSGGCSTAGGSSAWSWLLMFACALRHRRRDTITKRPQA